MEAGSQKVIMQWKQRLYCALDRTKSQLSSIFLLHCCELKQNDRNTSALPLTKRREKGEKKEATHANPKLHLSYTSISVKNWHKTHTPPLPFLNRPAFSSDSRWHWLHLFFPYFNKEKSTILLTLDLLVSSVFLGTHSLLTIQHTASPDKSG